MCSSTESRMRRLFARLGSERGQSTVEASFALPIVLVLALLLVQPGIILYDRIVMKAAAAEACRLLATSSGGGELPEDFVRRRLSAVPEHDLFHVHGGGCTWRIELDGAETASEASVTIRNEVRPVPLLGAATQLLGLTNADGNLEIKVSASQATQPAWALAAGLAPRGWVNAWNG